MTTSQPENPKSSDDRDQKLLTVTEAADIVRAPVATLRYWRHLGTGPRSRRGGRGRAMELWLGARNRYARLGTPVPAVKRTPLVGEGTV